MYTSALLPHLIFQNLHKYILLILLSGNDLANVSYHKTGSEALTVVSSTATYTLDRLEYTSISKTFLPLAGLRGVSMLDRASSETMFNDSKKQMLLIQNWQCAKVKTFESTKILVSLQFHSSNSNILNHVKAS